MTAWAKEASDATAGFYRPGHALLTVQENIKALAEDAFRKGVRRGVRDSAAVCDAAYGRAMAGQKRELNTTRVQSALDIHFGRAVQASELASDILAMGKDGSITGEPLGSTPLPMTSAEAAAEASPDAGERAAESRFTTEEWWAIAECRTCAQIAVNRGAVALPHRIQAAVAKVTMMLSLDLPGDDPRRDPDANLDLLRTAEPHDPFSPPAALRASFSQFAQSRYAEWKAHDEPPSAGPPSADAPDPVNQPAHYTAHPSGVECITITEHMGFLLGNAMKYIWRADHKGARLQDLKKARFYLDREIANLERAEAEGREDAE